MVEVPKFPNLIRELRKRLGLWQEQLVRQQGVCLHTVNIWNNGWATPLQMVSQPIQQFLQNMTA